MFWANILNIYTIFIIQYFFFNAIIMFNAGQINFNISFKVYLAFVKVSLFVLLKLVTVLDSAVHNL